MRERADTGLKGKTMDARRFHQTDVGDKVLACVGTSEHVAKVLDKRIRPNKFLLRFHLANGDAREQWRLPKRCEPAFRNSPMGPVCRHQTNRRGNETMSSKQCTVCQGPILGQSGCRGVCQSCCRKCNDPDCREDYLDLVSREPTKTAEMQRKTL